MIDALFYVGAAITGGLLGVFASKVGGGLKKVANRNRKFGADDEYWMLKDGRDTYLFTEEQLDIAKDRAANNKEDLG